MPSARPQQGTEQVVLLHGEALYLVEEEARQILDQWKTDLVSDFGLDTIDAGGVNAGRLRDAILQAPFLDPYRVVAVRGIAARRADGLSSALDRVPDTTRILLTVQGKLGPSSKLLKAVTGLGGRAADHAMPRGRALQDWVSRRAKEHGLPPTAGAQVARLARPDLGILDSELRKLAAYQASGSKLDQAAIRDLVVSDRPEEIFRLTDHLLPEPSAEAWRVIARLLEREQPTAIAYRLARHLALVLEVRERRDRGESLSDIQGAMREHPFVVQKAYQAAAGASPQRLEAGLRTLLEYEWNVKSGQVDAQLGIQGVLARL